MLAIVHFSEKKIASGHRSADYQRKDVYYKEASRMTQSYSKINFNNMIKKIKGKMMTLLLANKCCLPRHRGLLSLEKDEEKFYFYWMLREPKRGKQKLG